MRAMHEMATGFPCGAGEPRSQDEMLKQLPLIAEQTEYTTLKAELLPWMHTLCLKTTMASVRVNSLKCMAQVAARLDEDEASKMLQTAAKVRCLSLSHPISQCIDVLGGHVRQWRPYTVARLLLLVATEMLLLVHFEGIAGHPIIHSHTLSLPLPL